MSGIGLGLDVMEALGSVGIRSAGWQWIWAAGAEGGKFPPHKEMDRRIETTLGGFDVLPGEDVNHAHCRCYLKPTFRDERGRFAPAP